MVDMALEGDLLQGGGILVVSLVAATGILHKQSQTGVAVGIRASFAHSDGYLFQNFRILFGALGISSTFGSLNLRPFIMS